MPMPGGARGTRRYHAHPMPDPKPYRRFRARGSRDEGGLEQLRILTERERGAANGQAPRAPVDEPPRAPRIPPADLRARDRALTRAGRPWWSLRGLGPGGLVARGVLALLVLFMVWAVAGYLTVRGAVSQSNHRITDSARGLLAPSGGMLGSPTDILILGSDALPGQTRSRADTIMIMRLDPGSGRIKVLSIPRDMRVELGRLGGEKINAAYYYGHQAGMIRAVKRLTAIPIHHVIVVNFRGFPKVVDDVGGLTVNNPTPLSNCPYPGGRTVSFPGGDIHLNGTRALEYVRVRKCDDDFQRARRQQAFLAALKSKLASPMSLWRAPWNGSAVVRTLSTDMSVDDLVKFAWLQMRLSQRPEDRFVLAGTPQRIGRVDYVIEDPTQAAEQVRRFMGR